MKDLKSKLIKFDTVNNIAEIMTDISIFQYMAGLSFVDDNVRQAIKEDKSVIKLSETINPEDVVVTTDIPNSFMPFEDAVTYFMAKIPVDYSELIETNKEFKLRNFYITGIEQKDFVSSIQDLVGQSLKNGTPLNEFKRNATNLVNKYGITEINPNRLDIIHRTNVAHANGYGNVKGLMSSDVKKALPYWTYWAVGDDRTELSHALRSGVTLPADHPWWDSNFPPLRWRCRCTVSAYSKSMLDRRKLNITSKAQLKKVPELNYDFMNPMQTFKEGLSLKNAMGQMPKGLKI